MRNISSLLLGLLLSAAALTGQNVQVSAILNTNNVKAAINSDGALFTDFTQGQFVAPFVAGQPEHSLLWLSGLWIAGRDLAGNLKGAIQLYNQDQKSDFQPGLPDGALQGMWRVTKADIEEHLADLADNGVVDHPNAHVFRWPASGNSYFPDYNNGLFMPFNSNWYAGFFDADEDGRYDPTKGDYPSIEIRGCPLDRYPDEMLWFAFNDAKLHTQSGLAPMQMEVQAQVFAYYCSEESPLNNSVFVRFKLINRGHEWLDSCSVGLFTDFSIGNPHDDYFGTSPAQNLVFGYNADANDADYGSNAPAMAIQLLRGPLDTFGMELPLSHVSLIDNPEGLSGNDFFNLLNGRHLNGTPNPVTFPYPDDPNNGSGNSEATAGNPAGHRSTLSSFGPFTLLPGAVNEFIVGYTFFQQPGGTPLHNVSAMYDQAGVIQSMFDQCFSGSGLSCAPVGTQEASQPAALQIWPNPAAGRFTIQSEAADLRSVTLYDFSGRAVLKYAPGAPARQIEVPCEGLPAGMYAALVTETHGRVMLSKIVLME